MSTLGSLLVKNKVVGVVDIEKALQRQVIYGGDLATNLLELSIADERQIAKYVGQAFGMPVLDPSVLDAPDENTVRMLPWTAAEEHRIVPVRIEGDRMIVAASAPLREADLSEVAFLLGLEFAPHLVLEFRLAMALKRAFGIPMSDRFTALSKRLFPDASLDLPPIVASPDDDQGLLREATAAQDAKSPAEVSSAPVTEAAAAPPVTESPEDAMVNAVIDEALLDALPDAQDDVETTPAPADFPAEETAKPDATTVAGDAKAERDTREVPEEIRAARKSFLGRDTVPSEPPPSITAMGSGTLDIEDAAERLAAADKRDDILSVFMELVGNVFEYSMLFVIQGREARGHSLITDATELKRVEGPVLAIDDGGMLETAFNTRSIYLGSPGKTEADHALFQKMDRARPKNCVILPVVLRGRVILMLYSDSGAMGVKSESVSDLTRLTRLVADAFDRILMEKKYGKYRANVSVLPSRPAHMAFSKLPKSAADLESSAAAYRAAAADHSGKVRSKPLIGDSQPAHWQSVAKAMAQIQEGADSDTDRGPASSDKASDDSDAEEDGQSKTETSFDAPPDEAEPETGAAEPETDAAEPETETDTAEPEADVGDPGYSAKIPRKPRAERYDETVPTGIKYYVSQDFASDESETVSPDLAGPPEAEDKVTKAQIISLKEKQTRSVEVNMNEEIERLVERVLTPSGMDTAALEVLLGIGEDAIECLIDHFPGPLSYDRHQSSGKLLRVDKHGPLLKALTKFGEAAGPHLLPLFGSRDSDVRFYAVFLFSEIKYPKALESLISRIFDSDRQISAIAIDVLRQYSAYSEFRWALQKVVDLLAGSSRDLETKRVAARALGDLGDPLAIGTLIRMLDSVDSKLVTQCHEALVKICFSDFGYSRARWLEWYQSAGESHRLEWAIEGVTHKSAIIRKNAFQLLTQHISGVMEGEVLPENMVQAKVLQDRLFAWWDDEGRELYHFEEGE